MRTVFIPLFNQAALGVVDPSISGLGGGGGTVPPLSNTGGTEERIKGQGEDVLLGGGPFPSDFRICSHWFAVTVFEGRYEAERLLLAWVGKVEWVESRAVNGYQFGMVSADGVRLLWSDNRPEAHIIVSGAACDELAGRGVDLMLPFMTWAREGVGEDGKKTGTVFTRWDIAFDGWRDEAGNVIQPWDIYRMIAPRVGGDYNAVRTPGRRSDKSIRGMFGSDFVKPVRSTLSPLVEAHDASADTLYIGCRASDRMVRMYTARGFCRMELELKGERLELVRTAMRGVRSGDSFESVAVGLLTDYVEFVEVNPQPTRAKLQPWFARCVEGFEKVTVTCRRRAAGGVLAAVRNLRRYGRLYCELLQALSKCGRDGAAELHAIMCEKLAFVKDSRVERFAWELHANPYVVDSWAQYFRPLEEYQGELPVLEPVPF